MAYGCYTTSGRYVAAAHTQAISNAFRRCATTPNGRLLIIAPPRHGKSETVSYWGCAWYLSRWPERRVMLGSYAAALAQGWGQRVRDVLREVGPSIGVAMGATTAMEDWATDAGGGMRSVGFDGAITGRGAHLLVVDDAVKGQEAALSPTQQQGVWNRWLSDFSTRKQPAAGDFGGTSIVVIGTRWSERDLIGRLLAAHAAGPTAEGYEDWEILYLPAIYDGLDWTGRRPYEDPLGRQKGEALWPSAWSVEFLEAEARRSPWWYAALFQGRPQPLEGGILRAQHWGYWCLPGQGEPWHEPVEMVVHRETFAREPRPLADVTRLILSVDAAFAVDLQAMAKGKERSAVAIHAWALDAGGRKLIIDRHTEQLDFSGSVEAIKLMHQRLAPGGALHGALGLSTPAPVVVVEYKALGAAIVVALRRKGISCVLATPHGSKVERVIGSGATEAQRLGRATAFADEQRAGQVYLPHPALVIAGRMFTWSLDLRHAFASFPAGGKDDTDAASQAWAALATTHWMVEDEAKHQADRDAAAARRLARVPEGVPIPSDTRELFKAQNKAAVQRELQQALDKIRREQRTRGTATQRRTGFR